MLTTLAALGAWSLAHLLLPLAVWTAAALAALGFEALLPLRRPLVRRNVLAVLLLSLPVGLAGRALVHPWRAGCGARHRCAAGAVRGGFRGRHP